MFTMPTKRKGDQHNAKSRKQLKFLKCRTHNDRKKWSQTKSVVDEI